MRTALTLSFLLAFPHLTPAQELVAGSPAPALQIAKWVKGRPTKAFVEGRVYVVEFWATWCAPCRESIPQLNALQKTHTDKLTVIGVTSVDERNSLETVEAFVTEQGTAMGYTVAWDDAQKTHESYLAAAGMDGIPTCFVIDARGKVAWIGHPMWLEAVLPPVIAGTHDAEQLGEAIGGIEKRLIRTFLAAGDDTPKALADMKALLEEHPFLTEIVEAGVFDMMLTAGVTKDAWPIGARVIERAMAKQDVIRLNEAAWAIVNPENKLPERNLELALEAASKAVALTKEKDADVLDTLARVYFWKKDLTKAVELQQKAVALQPDNETLRAALADYAKALGGK